MQYREDPRSGNKISILGFGCMRLPGGLARVDIQKTEKLFLEAIDKGVNYFDTAYLYPGSESALGEIFTKNNIREKIFIATKLPQTQCTSYEDFDKYFTTQLKRLKTTYIDYYFMHNISKFEQWQNLCDLGIKDWIKEKQETGQIKQIGFSFHGPSRDFELLLDAYDWDFCQIQYNYINIHYQAGVTGLKKAHEKGLPVFIMEPLLGGKLATGLPSKAVEAFEKAEGQYSNVGWALRWLWNQPEVTMVLSGMNELDQLDENIGLANQARENMLTSDEESIIQKVIKIFNDSYKIPCTGCNYCMPCPKGINIPACFTAYNSSYAFNRMTGFNHYVLSTAAISKKPHYAGDCIKCGKCESHCPQKIKIRDSLEDVTKRLEPFWLRMGLSVYRKFSG